MTKISGYPRRNDLPLGALVPVAADGHTYSVPVAAFLTTLYDIRSYGASTSLTDGQANMQALQNAALAANNAGGGIVYIPAGLWWVTHGSLDVNVVCQINGLSRVVFAGEGPGVSRLKLANGADASFFNLTGGASQIVIRDLELDGNRANQTPNIVHGVRGDAFGGLWLDRLYIHDISHYGIGIEGFVQQYMFFTNIKLANLGGDGFDQKNKSDANLYQVATNIAVTEFGLAGTTQTGWDCRGAWQLSNIVVHFTTCTTGSGIRFRNGETSTPVDGGFGGHRSHVSNVEIYGPGTGSSATGIEAVARDCVVQGAYIRDVLFGVSCSYDAPTSKGCSRSKFSDITVENFGTAGFITSANANDNEFDNCTAIGGGVGSYGFRLRSSGNRVTNPRCSEFVSAGVSIDTAGARSTVTTPEITGPGGATAVGIDVNAADCKAIGGNITACNRGVVSTAARTKCVGVNSYSNTDAGFLAAVGADDASFVDCTASANGTRGIHSRASRTKVLGGEIISNVGAGFLTEATSADCGVDAVYFNGNGAAIDDAGARTRFGLMNVGLATPYLLTSIRVLAGTGSPESVHAAPVGSVFHRTDGGASTSIYVKETGTGNTGWVAK